MAAALLLAGCGKKTRSSDRPASPEKAPADAVSASPLPPAKARANTVSAPVTQPILTVWQEGDQSTAVSRFLEADWSARPLFAAGMALSLSEGQFKALPDADRQLKSSQMMAQVELMKQMASAVAQAGREAAAKGDAAQARKCFTSLKQFGMALDSPDRLRLVQMVGQVSKKMADTELAKMGQ